VPKNVWEAKIIKENCSDFSARLLKPKLFEDAVNYSKIWVFQNDPETNGQNLLQGSRESLEM
jgi:hypothetical protein